MIDIEKFEKEYFENNLYTTWSGNDETGGYGYLHLERENYSTSDLKEVVLYFDTRNQPIKGKIKNKVDKEFGMLIERL